MPRESLPAAEREDVSVYAGGSEDRGSRRPGLVPFVSHRPGAYDRLLFAVYVRWKTGLLVASDWLRPVTRGCWRVGPPTTVPCGADVS